MSKVNKRRVRKTWKIVTIISTSFLMACILSLVVFLFLDNAGVISMTDGVNRQYTMTFKVDGEVVYEKTLYRGAVIDYSEIKDPVKDGSLYKYYVFDGWDINGDGHSDILPKRAYSSYVAEAVFWESTRR